MGTVASGTSAQVYYPLAIQATFTPDGSALLSFSGPDAPQSRTIWAAAVVDVPSGTTVFIEARDGAVTYTAPALTAEQVDAVTQMVGPDGSWVSSYPFELAAISAGVLAANRVRYYAPLTHTIVPALGSTPTHSRACAGSVVDCYGVMHFVGSGELRFHGARRVANLIGDTEAFSTGWTLGSNTTRTAAPSVSGLAAPRRNVYAIARSSGSSVMLTLNSAAYRPGVHCFSVGLSGNGSTTVRLRIERSSDSALVAQLDVVPTSQMQRFAVAGSITDTTNHRVTATVTTSGAASFNVCCAQLEYGTSVPNEYIAKGVESSPYYGAMVDGVKYFPYYRPTEIDADGVVAEELRADPIPASIMLGVVVEPLGNSNKWYSSRDPGAAQWTLTNATAGAQASCDLLGYNSLRRIVENSSNGLHRTSQTWRSTGNANGEIDSVSAYVQKGERDWIVVGLVQRDTSTEVKAWFNLATGEAGTVTGDYVETFIYQEGDCWRVGISAPSGTGATDVVGFFGLASADGVESYAGDGASGHLIGACQIEEHDFPTNYTGDSGTASLISRVSETLQIAIGADTLPATEWTVASRHATRGKTDQDNKSSWWYFWYWYFDANNRGGFTARRGEFAGGTSENFDDWAYDAYPNSSSPDIDAILSGVSCGPLEPFKAACRYSAAAFRDSSALGMAVNGTIGAHQGTATTASISASVVTLHIGAQQDGAVDNAKRCATSMTRGFAIFDYAMTDAELQAESLNV